MSNKILLVDDDPQTLAICQDYLRVSGYDVITATDGLQGLAAAWRERPDLILLDLILPEMDGLEVCRMIRRKSTVPVIMLTGRAQEADKVIGLEVGADDYLTKPFSLRELVARVGVVLRRASDGSTPEIIQVGNVLLDKTRYEIQVAERAVRLTPMEFEIMAALMSQPGCILSRAQLSRAAHVFVTENDGRAIDSHIRNLRHKLKPEELIFTVQGVGYQFGKETVSPDL